MTPSNAEPPEGIKNMRNYLGLPPTDPKDPQADIRDAIRAVNHGGIDADGSTDTNRLVKLFQAYQQELLTELLGELPKKRELLEPVTKRVVTEVGDKVGIDVDADLKGSLKFVQDNGYNTAIDQVVSVIQSKIGELNG